jgi:AraC-like DNA-binding protein
VEGAVASAPPERTEYTVSSDVPFVGGVTSHPSPTSPATEIHECFEVGVVLGGRYEMRVEQHVFTLGPGDIWLCMAWEPHTWRTTVPNTELLPLLFLPEFLGDATFGGLSWLRLFALAPEERPRVTTPQMRQRTLAIAQEICSETVRPFPGAPTPRLAATCTRRGKRAERRAGWLVAVRLSVLRLLWEVSRDTWPKLPVHPHPVRAGDLSRVVPAVDLTHADPACRLTVPEAAAACRLSLTEFNSIFRRAFGVSFHKFRVRVRLWHVERLLSTTGLSLTAIADQTGFADASHLHHVFSRAYGCTPLQYREGRRSFAGP